MTGVAESCRSICQGVGCPSPASAAPALASNAPAVTAMAVKRENTFIVSFCSLFLILVTTVHGERRL